MRVDENEFLHGSLEANLFISIEHHARVVPKNDYGGYEKEQYNAFEVSHGDKYATGLERRQ